MYLEITSPVAFPYGWPAPTWGMGDQQSANQAVAAGSAALTAGAAVAQSLGLISAAAVPFIGPAIAAVTIGIGTLVRNSGCGITCVETSQWANQAEPLLAQDLQEYFAVPPPRAKSLKETALKNFDSVWATLRQQCGQPGTGNAGVRCISDRQAGACKWKQTADSPLLGYPGEPQPGECWNWFSGYRDPIANDTEVVPDAQLLAQSAAAAGTAATNSLLGTLASTTGLSTSNLLLLAAVGLVVAGLVMS